MAIRHISLRPLVRLLTALLGAFTALSTIAGADTRAVVDNQCSGCHLLREPAPHTQTLAERMARKAPPLFYAGHKYRRTWLEQWLQAPTRITPTGGGFWANAVEVTPEGDAINVEKLLKHPAVDASTAKRITDYLLQLKPRPELIRDGEYQPGKANPVLAAKNFRKFKGCGSCHRDEKDYGGVTGPELYTAMQRLRPSFIASYIRDPSAWDSRTLMPVQALNDAAIYKLMHYLNAIGEEP